MAYVQHCPTRLWGFLKLGIEFTSQKAIITTELNPQAKYETKKLLSRVFPKSNPQIPTTRARGSVDIINNPIPLTPQDIEMVPNMHKTRTVQPKLPDYADYVGLGRSWHFFHGFESRCWCWQGSTLAMFRLWEGGGSSFHNYITRDHDQGLHSSSSMQFRSSVLRTAVAPVGRVHS